MYADNMDTNTTDRGAGVDTPAAKQIARSMAAKERAATRALQANARKRQNDERRSNGE